MISPPSRIKQESLKIISNYFGEKIAAMYEKKFAGQTDAMILIMVRMLLGEYLGKDQTEERMSELHKLN